MKLPGCGCNLYEDNPPALGLAKRLRIRRGIAGLVGMAVVGVCFYFGAWLSGLLLLWLAFWHLVAALIGYRGCPELGLPTSLLKRRFVFIHGVWCRSDKRFLSS
jgi:hypothetical protein